MALGGLGRVGRDGQRLARRARVAERVDRHDGERVEARRAQALRLERRLRRLTEEHAVAEHAIAGDPPRAGARRRPLERDARVADAGGPQPLRGARRVVVGAHGDRLRLGEMPTGVDGADREGERPRRRERHRQRGRRELAHAGAVAVHAVPREPAVARRARGPAEGHAIVLEIRGRQADRRRGRVERLVAAQLGATAQRMAAAPDRADRESVAAPRLHRDDHRPRARLADHLAVAEHAIGDHAPPAHARARPAQDAMRLARRAGEGESRGLARARAARRRGGRRQRDRRHDERERREGKAAARHSTVTVLARLRGWSTLRPRSRAAW